RDPYLRYAAQAALGSIDQALDEGRDPLAPPDIISRRLNAATAVQNGKGSFFDLLLTSKKSANADDGGKDLGTSAQSAACYPQHANFALGQPGAYFAPRSERPSAD